MGARLIAFNPVFSLSLNSAVYGKLINNCKTRNRKVSLKAGMLGGLDAGKPENMKG